MRSQEKAAASIGMMLILLMLLGCGNGASYSGTVTYDGAEVEDGHISFIPLEDKAPPVGVPIQKGKYRISGLKSGKMRVHVSAVKQTNSPGGAVDPDVPLPEPMATMIDLIPANAIGNDPTIDVKPGSHTLDLKLEKPAGK